MIKNEFVFRDNIAIIRDIETGAEMIHQPLRPTWGDPEPWASEDQAREWAYTNFYYYFEDMPEPPTLPPDYNPTANDTTPGE